MANTHMWDLVWRNLEKMGIPVDSLQASRWDKAHGDNASAPLARMLLDQFDAITRARLTAETIDRIGEIACLAFEMGRRSEGGD